MAMWVSPIGEVDVAPVLPREDAETEYVNVVVEIEVITLDQRSIQRAVPSPPVVRSITDRGPPSMRTAASATGVAKRSFTRTWAYHHSSIRDTSS